MWIRQKKGLLIKASLLLAMLVGVFVVFGCVGIRSTPEGGSGGVIADGTLFLAPTLRAAGGAGCASALSCEASPTEGKLIALDSSAGTRLWEISLEATQPAGGLFGCGSATAPVAIYGTPAVAEDLVYVGTYNGKIYAINSTSGVMRWVYPREGNLQPIVGGTVVALGKIYFGCSDGKVYALDAATGDKQWEFPTEDKIWATPAIDGTTLYIGSFDKSLYALDAANGNEKWHYETGGAIASTPLVKNNTVYIGSFDRYFYAISTTQGNLKWKLPSENWFWSRPLVYNDVIYAGSLDNRVYVLDAESGAELVDPIDLESPIVSSPVLVDDRVIIATEEGKIYAIDTSSKGTQLLADLEEGVNAPLVASEEVVYIHTQTQTLYALNVQTGVTLWSLPLK